jgi:hypothetical protein
MDRRREEILSRAMKDSDPVGISIGVVPRTGRSFKEKGLRISRSNYAYFASEPQKRRECKSQLEREGFQITGEGRFGVSILGEKKLVEKFFGTRIDLATHTLRHGQKTIKIRIPSARLTIPKKLSSIIDVANLEQYPIPLESATPPSVAYYHLNVPDDVANLMGASDLHTCGYDGSGIKLCMIDDGFFEHAYYTSRGYNITLIPVGLSTMQEGKGHGTAIASNALAIAPNAEFIFINNQIWIFSVATAAFQTARAQNPDVITCSWGLTSYDSVLAAEIADAVADGITVLFACGNGGPVYFPGCMDEIISIGGVYPVEGGGFEASSYASSGECSSNPGRQCPDVCGLVGNAPHGVLIMMPTVPEGYYDDEFAASDGTATDDGWICASGTSSATPQVAGVAALMLQCEPTLTPEQVKTHLQNAATDITAGTSASGEGTGPGVDLATGHGLVNAADTLEDLGCACGSCTFASEVCLRVIEVGDPCLFRREVLCQIRTEACPSFIVCKPTLMSGCHVSIMTGPGGCGPVSLIADYGRWWEQMRRDARFSPAAARRLERMLSLPMQGKHVRTLTARKKAGPAAGGIRTQHKGIKRLGR